MTARPQLSQLRSIILVLLPIAMIHPITLAAASEELDELAVADTSSPRATLQSFLSACNTGYRMIERDRFIDADSPQARAMVEQVIDCIDTSQLPEFAREDRACEVAICIKEIIDRYPFPDWDEIPDMTDIEKAGGFEALSRYRIPGTRITIARVEQGAQKHEYLFSVGTVDRAVDYFNRIRNRDYRTDGPAVTPKFYTWFLAAPRHRLLGSIVHKLPESMRYGRTWGLSNWKWPGVIALGILLHLTILLECKFHFWLVMRSQGRHVFFYCATLVIPIIAMLTPYVYWQITESYLAVRGNALYFISTYAIAATIVAAIFVAFAFSNRLAAAVVASPRVNPKGINAQLTMIGSRFLSIAMAVAIVLYGGQYLGIPVATLLASAGIGGVALALAAQDTLKTLFGTLMLMADKPFRVGERIVVQGYDGIVEEMGLRSTRIRLLNSHQVTIPNDQLSGSDIENIGRRDCIRQVTDLCIPLATPADKVQRAVELVRIAVQDHEGMNPDQPPRVNFFEFGPQGYVIRIFLWYHPPEYWEFLDFNGKLNLEICAALEREGIPFLLPHRITTTGIDGASAPVPIQNWGPPPNR